MAGRRVACLALSAVMARAIKVTLMDGDLKAQEKVDDIDDEDVPTGGSCEGCEFTVDLRCSGLRSARQAPFHRIQDCLIPLYGLIDLAREADRKNGTKVCAVTWLDPWEGLCLSPFLRYLVGVNWHSVINERSECARSLKYHAVNRTKVLMATDAYLADFGMDDMMIKAYPIDVRRNLQQLQLDANRLVAAPSPQIVVLHRKGDTRSFRSPALNDLTTSLSSNTGLPVVLYLGQERAIDTIKMFNQAYGIVGYHGAAWVNAYFATRHHCIQQISTFYDFENEQTWRISKELMLNPWGSWYFYYLPLRMLLNANHVKEEAYMARTEKDHFIKDLAFVPLRSVDIDDLTSHMVECLEDPEAYSKSHPNPELEFATHDLDTPAPLPGDWPRVVRAPSTVAPARDDCSGCDFTVDLRCEGIRLPRYDFYNRVSQCLLPLYEMIQLAREAGSNSSAHVCAITWLDSKGYNLEPFLTNLVDVKWHKLVDENDACAAHLQFHAVERTNELGAIESSIGAPRANMIRSLPISMQVNLNWMQRDAVNIVRGPPYPNVILIQGHKTRMFSPSTFQNIHERLSQFIRLPVQVYSEDKGKSVLETLKVFTNAAGAVGYYGDAWVNAFFMSYPHCITQISTYYDLEKQKRWRINEDIKAWNKMGEWYFKHLPLDQVLQENNISTDTFSNSADKDHFIKNLPWVSLSEEDIVEAVSQIFLCWQNKQRAYEAMQQSWHRHN